MQLFRTLLAAAAVVIAFLAGPGAIAAERRLALVVGESAYGAKPLPTAANDAGLIAQTLQAAGFDVTGARDLEEAALRQSFRDFLDKAAEAGPDAVVFVYFSGYGVQFEGENYLLPVDVRLARDADIPLRALRVSDYLKPLAASSAKLSVVVLDAGRENPFSVTGQPLAGGLALYEPGGRTLLAYNAAPGTIAPEAKGDYGPYAHALAEMIRDGGAPLMDVFENTRLRVSEMTKGGQIPWNSQSVQTDFVFFQRDANAPARAADASRLAQPIKALGPDEGFSAALRRDTLQGYEEYVAAFPDAPYAKRARAILAARREALTWRRTRIVDTSNAYWSYLRRYPKGPHSWDARRRLAEMRFELEPPATFEMIDYDYPPPPPEEVVFVEQPAVYFDDPMWGFVPPPPPPLYLLPPPPPDFVVLAAPVVIAEPYILPAPPFVPIPVWQRAPAYIVPPPNDFFFANAHNAIVLDPRANNYIVRNPAGVVAAGGLTAAGAGAAAMAVGAALPNFLAKRNALAPAAAGVAPPLSGGAVGQGLVGQPHVPLGPAPGAQLPPAGPVGANGLFPAARGVGAALPPEPAAAHPHGGPDGHALPVPGPGEAARPLPGSGGLGRVGEGRDRRNLAPLDPARNALEPGGGGPRAHGGLGRPSPIGGPPPGAEFRRGAGDFRRGTGEFPRGAGDFPRGAGDFPRGAGDFGHGGMFPPGGPDAAARHSTGGRYGPAQPPAQGFDGGPMPPSHRGGGGAARGPYPGDPYGRPMREPMAAPAPGMRDPGAAGWPSRGFPRDVMPGGSVAAPHMRAGPLAGMPPQMRDMAQPPMHAAPVDRGPPGGMMRPAPQQAAPAMMRPSAPAAPQGFGGVPTGGGQGGGHVGGGNGGGGGFGGGGFGGMR